MLIKKYNTGYYTVGNNMYTNKLLAVMDGSKNNKEINWHFHQDIFNKVDWTIKTNTNLTTLYRERAKRIREKYDKVILLFSGGIDSTTVLESFLDQNLIIDEIVTSWSVEAAEAWALPEQNKNPENYIGEWNYCIRPRLKLLQNTNPQIKITILDSTQDIVKNVYAEEDFFLFDSYHNLPGMNRWGPLVKHLEKVCEDTENTVILLGLDKPQFLYKDENLYLVFLDVNMHLKSNEKINYEYFYCDPDGIEIMKCQSHIVCDYFRDNPHLRKMLLSRDDDFLVLLNTLIYPTYDPNRFQALKQRHLIYNEQQAWAWKLSQYQDGKYVDKFNNHWKNILSVIDKRYIRYKNGIFDGLHGLIGSTHFIGNIGSEGSTNV